MKLTTHVTMCCQETCKKISVHHAIIMYNFVLEEAAHSYCNLPTTCIQVIINRGVSRKSSRGVLNYRRALARAIFWPRPLVS